MSFADNCRKMQNNRFPRDPQRMCSTQQVPSTRYGEREVPMRVRVRWTAVLAAGVAFAGCVTKSTYLKQVQTAEQLSAQKAALAGDLAKTDQERKALEENLAASKAENAKLLGSLDAKKGELNQRVAELSKENQDLAQHLRDTEQAKEAEINRLKGTYDQLVGNLKDQINAGQIQITQLAGRLSVNMVDKILFNSGEANIKSEGEKVLLQVGSALKAVPDKAIRVEGHTDNV